MNSNRTSAGSPPLHDSEPRAPIAIPEPRDHTSTSRTSPFRVAFRQPPVPLATVRRISIPGTAPRNEESRSPGEGIGRER